MALRRRWGLGDGQCTESFGRLKGTKKSQNDAASHAHPKLATLAFLHGASGFAKGTCEATKKKNGSEQTMQAQRSKVLLLVLCCILAFVNSKRRYERHNIYYT
jgi:hypothetical protein